MCVIVCVCMPVCVCVCVCVCMRVGVELCLRAYASELLSSWESPVFETVAERVFVIFSSSS